MSYVSSDSVGVKKKVRVPDIRSRKGGKKITCLTCYDASFARILEQTSIDLVLVGDSLGNVIQGASSTTCVTVDDVAYHTRCVAAALRHPLLVSDMPFGTAGFSFEVAFSSAQKLIRAGAEAVKIEGATPEICTQISHLVRHGIPVLGHIGLLPQSVHMVGGYRVQGRGVGDCDRLISEARALRDAGCFGIVVELVPSDVAKSLSHSIDIPVIGIGAGCGCDGQILVLNDMLGMNLSFSPKYLKHFSQVEKIVREAIERYCYETCEGVFPSED